MSEQPQTRAYDMALYRKDVAEGVRTLMRDIDLRKWCIEKAVAAGIPPGVESVSGRYLVTLVSEQFYQFVTEIVSQQEPPK